MIINKYAQTDEWKMANHLYNELSKARQELLGLDGIAAFAKKKQIDNMNAQYQEVVRKIESRYGVHYTPPIAFR